MLVLLPMLAFTGCISESDDCPPDPSPIHKEGALNLQFAIVTRNASGEKNAFSSRAADISGEQVGAMYENYINIGADGAASDLVFFLFDKDRQFLETLNVTDTKCIFTSSDYSLYTFKTPVTNRYFHANIDNTFEFYILAIANARSMGLATVPGPAAGQTIDSYFTTLAATARLLTAKPVTSLLLNPAGYTTSAQHFPMAGLRKFSVDGPELKKSTEFNPYDVSYGGRNINMLRAVAKIEVIDRVNITGTFTDADADDPLRIDKVQIDGIMGAGSVVPRIVEWTNADADETQQVDAPSVPAGATYYAPVALEADGSVPATASPANATIEFEPDAYSRSLRADNCPVYSCYLYEYDNAAIGNRHIPYMRVTTKGDGTAAVASLVRPIQLAYYTDGAPATPLDALLRNHIYRYEVVGINADRELQIVWTVCPMDNVEIDIPPFN